MQQTITLTLEINVKVLNQILALAQEYLVTTEEQRQSWDQLILSTDNFSDKDLLMAIGSMALLAKGNIEHKQLKNKK